MDVKVSGAKFLSKFQCFLKNKIIISPKKVSQTNTCLVTFRVFLSLLGCSLLRALPLLTLAWPGCVASQLSTMCAVGRVLCVLYSTLVLSQPSLLSLGIRKLSFYSYIAVFYRNYQTHSKFINYINHQSHYKVIKHMLIRLIS